MKKISMYVTISSVRDMDIEREEGVKREANISYK